MNIYVARQPIFKKDKAVFGYELLFRDGLNNAFPKIEGNEATSRLLSNSFLGMGVEQLTGKGYAFVNFTRDLLVNRVPMLFPRDQIVVEILEDVEPEDEVVEACREISGGGYTLALDDFIYRPEMARLISFSNIIKFDLRETPLDTLHRVIEKLSRYNIQFLAEKVETYEEFQTACTMGFDYFQGYFFSRPEVLEGKSIESAQMNLLAIMAEANRRDVEFHKLEKIIERDIGISYKLLRHINSAFYRRVAEITSIRQAVVFLGENGVRRFLSLIAMSNLADGKPDELTRQSMVRARFCEKLGTSGTDQSELFTLGLFSLIDAIMDKPMEVLMRELPLSEGIKTALVDGEGAYGSILRLVSNYEKCLWEEVDKDSARLGLDADKLPEVYTDAVTWADSIAA